MEHRELVRQIDPVERFLAVVFLRSHLSVADQGHLRAAIKANPRRWWATRDVDGASIRRMMQVHGCTAKKLGFPLEVVWMGLVELACCHHPLPTDD